jgi:hypothetical protein
MKVNYTAQQVLNAYIAKWKAEDDKREAEARLEALLSRPASAAFRRRI